MATSYQISDVVERTGFSAATLRYYEEILLLPESPRSPAGYRLYDDHTLERLAFIARAKQLGCTLAEIRSLSLAWDGGQCGPVQEELRSVVADKLMQAEEQISELRTLISDLERAAGFLEQHRPLGPCDDQCGCISDPTVGAAEAAGATTTILATPGTSQAITLGQKPDSAKGGAPIACTLASTAMPDRLADWRQLLSHVVNRQTLPRGFRAMFGPDAPLDELMRLVAAEQDCCRFFDFSITVDSRGIALEARSPADALPLLESVFGAPA